MSQSVNRGEKPAATEAAADAVESVEAAAPAESATSRGVYDLAR